MMKYLKKLLKKLKKVIVMNKMYEYLKNHAYISCSKKSTYEFELSEERAECIANKYDSLTEELQQENKILRDNAEHNEKVVDKVNWENMLLKKENEQLKAINKEYERLNKVNNRGFKITNVKEYDIDELLSYKKYKDNWNKLKKWLEKELGDRINPNKDKWLTGVYDAYRETIDKMQELEQGSDSNE